MCRTQTGASSTHDWRGESPANRPVEPAQAGQLEQVTDLRRQLNGPTSRGEPEEGGRPHQAGAVAELEGVRTLGVEADEHSEQRPGAP